MDYNEITNRIDELNLDGYKHIKNNDWGIPDQLTDWLKERNFKLIGEGAFSDVYISNTENFVVKINNKEDFDQEYMNFAKYCYNNKTNPHLPKVGKIKTFKLQDDEEDSYEAFWFVVFIEKLEPYSDDLFGLGIVAGSTSIIFNYLVNQELTEKEEIQNWFNYKKWNINPSDEQYAQLIGCIKTLIDFKKYSNIGNRHFDLHNGNIMQRNGTAVITDPVA